AGKLQLASEPFSPRHVAAEVVRMLGWRARQKGVAIACEAAAGVPDTVIGDGDRLRQVLLNLVGNAVKFPDRGEVGGRVRAEAEAGDPPCLHFAVSDTGIGISPEPRHRLFQAFEQGDTSITRKRGGTGLGLAISARLVRLMGGRIWVESSP